MPITYGWLRPGVNAVIQEIERLELNTTGGGSRTGYRYATSAKISVRASESQFVVPGTPNPINREVSIKLISGSKAFLFWEGMRPEDINFIQLNPNRPFFRDTADGGIRLDALVAGVTLGGLASGIITTAETLYSFNINISDKQIKEDIKAAIDGLYEPAGNFLGRQIATIAVGGLRSPPKVKIDVDTMALIWELRPELRQQLLQNVSNFAWQGIQVGITIAIKYGFLHGRQAIKRLWKRLPGAIKKLSPKLDKAIQTWGAGW